jgi:hypothetical protein
MARSLRHEQGTTSLTNDGFIVVRRPGNPKIGRRGFSPRIPMALPVALSLQDLGIIIAIILGLYGSILSTMQWLSQERRAKPQIRALLDSGVTVFTGLGGPGIQPLPSLLFQLIHDGDIPISVSEVSLELPNGGGHAYLALNPPNPLPYTLEPRKNLSHAVTVDQIARDLRRQGLSGVIKIRARFRDATGRVYKSTPRGFNVATQTLDV